MAPPRRKLSLAFLFIMSIDKLTYEIECFEKIFLGRADVHTMLRFRSLLKEIDQRESYIEELENTTLALHYKHIRHKEMAKVLAATQRLKNQYRSFITTLNGHYKEMKT